MTNAIAGMINAVAGMTNAIAGMTNAIAGITNAIAGMINAIAGINRFCEKMFPTGLVDEYNGNTILVLWKYGRKKDCAGCFGADAGHDYDEGEGEKRVPLGHIKGKCRRCVMWLRTNMRAIFLS
jgi:hypothetical protein